MRTHPTPPAPLRAACAALLLASTVACGVDPTPETADVELPDGVAPQYASTTSAISTPDAAKWGRLAGFENHDLGGGANQWITTRSTSYRTIDKLSGAFVTKAASTDIAVTISADAVVEARARRLYLRALVDGRVLDPGSIVFATSEETGSHAFVFHGNVGPGSHIVQFMWRSDSSNATAKMRNASVTLRTATRSWGVSSLSATSRSQGGDETIAGDAWRNVVDARVDGFVVSGQDLEISFAAESYSASGAPLYVRALVDGVQVAPGLIRFTQHHYRQARMLTFTATGLSTGIHTVQIQARSNWGGRGFLGKPTVIANAVDRAAANHSSAYRAASGWSSGPSSNWRTVPSMSRTIDVPPNGEVVARFTADVRERSSAPIYFRMRVDGRTTGLHTVHTSDDTFGIVHRTFVIKGLNNTASTVRRTVYIEWMTAGSGNTTIGPRGLSVTAERGQLPDTFGKSPFSGTWPTRGSRRLLVLLVDNGDPTRPLVARSTIEDHLFGAHGMRDYFLEQSNNRFSVTNAGVFGYYTLNRALSTYFPDLDCDDPNSRGFVSGGREIWMEVLQKANADVNFASYDNNRDGKLTEDELGILFVGREMRWVNGAWRGGSVNRDLVNCSDSPLGRRITLDGVQLDMHAASWAPLEPNQSHSFSAAAHELGHLFLGLPDMYQDNFDSPTEPRAISLMGSNARNTSSIDAVNRMHLGWMDYDLVATAQNRTLEDVGYSRRAVVLPRLDGLSTEYFVVENRQNKSAQHSKYDTSIGESGLAVWHVIDPRSPDGPALQDSAPRCLSAMWNHDDFKRSSAREGIRLVRPGIIQAGALWRNTHGNLEDRSANPMCPVNGRPGTQLLEWADGLPSGYRLIDVSAAMRTMSFRVERGNACIVDGINICNFEFNFP